MHETYRLLGKEREADLRREAQRLHRAATVRPTRSSGKVPADSSRRMMSRFIRALVAGFGRPKPEAG